MGANSMEISMDRDNTKLMLNELKGLDSILLATEQSFTLHFPFDVISWNLHMGQFPQDGENVCFTVFFF